MIWIRWNKSWYETCITKQKATLKLWILQHDWKHNIKITMVKYIIGATGVKKKGSMLLLCIMNVCEMQGQIPMNNMFWHVNMSIPINLFWLLFQKNYLQVFPSVWLRNLCKTYLFMKLKYFAPIEMLYNILKVCYDIYWENWIKIIIIRKEPMKL